MKKTIHKSNKTQFSIAAGAGIGIITAIVISVLLTMLYSILMMNSTVNETPSAILVFIIRAISVALGGFVAGALTKEHCLPVAGLTATGYLIVIIGMGITVFNGSFNNFGNGLLSALVGSAIPCLQKLKRTNKRRKIAKFR